jgi:hypothetical protein
LIDEGALVTEQHVLVSDGDDVVVKRAGVDGGGILLDEDGSRRVEAVQARNRLRRLARLSGGEAGGRASGRV